MNLLKIVQANMDQATAMGLSQQTSEDPAFDGRHVTLEGRELLSFSSCSYLGLELEPRVIDGAKRGLERYGAFFSSSRAYLRSPLYAQLETRLRTIFEAAVVITPTTTLGHLSALPLMLQRGDTLLIDRQVHGSVQMTAQLVAGSGVEVGFVEHNDVQGLEAKLQEHARQGRGGRVVFAADGVYSMFGDVAPLQGLSELLTRYEALWLYIDDAHGMSWTGARGQGYAKTILPKHPRVVVAVSLAKAFGTGGGALVFHDEALAQHVQSCAGPMIFSGQLPPSVLGAAIAAADIHLAPDMGWMQRDIAERIALCRSLLKDRGISPVCAFPAPIVFVPTLKLDAALILGRQLKDEGFWVNVAGFPATPRNGAGLRFTITRHLTLQDIADLVDALAYHMPLVLDQFELSPERISNAPAYRRVTAWPLAA